MRIMMNVLTIQIDVGVPTMPSEGQGNPSNLSPIEGIELRPRSTKRPQNNKVDMPTCLLKQSREDSQSELEKHESLSKIVDQC